MFRDDVTERIGEISCPVLIIHGEEDQAILIEAAEDLMGRLSDCRGLVRVAGAAHAPNMTHPEIVNDTTKFSERTLNFAYESIGRPMVSRISPLAEGDNNGCNDN